MKIASIAGAALLPVAIDFGSAICEEGKPLYNVGEGNLALPGYDPEGIKQETDRVWRELVQEFARKANREPGDGNE